MKLILFNLNNLLKNKTFHLMNLMILISFLSIFLSNFIQLWLIMEINTMLLIIMMSIFNKFKKTTINYLIIQSISSLSLIMLMIMNKNFNKNFMDFMIMFFFFMKLNLFPFFFWMPLINNHLNWTLIFFMSTTQKIIPLLMMNLYFNQINLKFIYMILLTTIFSSLISVLLSINETNMKKIITYSSMNHSAWMILIMMIDKYLFIMYFFLYSISMIFICLFFNKFKINNFNKLNNILFLNSKWMMPSIIFNLLLISSLPPFLTFLIKIKTLNVMIMNSNNFMILTLLILSISTLIFYMNILIKIKMIFMLKIKFWLSFNLQIKNLFFNLLMFMFMSLAMLFLISIII
uniref:NADH dehydrogenase subunit 2 n=1 Tax=Polistes hebraeus TaxID=202806 RepID=UPI001F1306B8|nr:NADH dehydrogenase subunit 2 [Polistes hebraeus]UMB50746.1 NADH dehydrogenase subunit 2 [Polistes hebraeus]